MDLLFKKYASPFDLLKLYINNGRFGEFVTEFLQLEAKQKQERIDKEVEDKLWSLYVHSFTDEPYGTWRKKFSLHTVRKPVKKASGAVVTREDILNNKRVQRLLNGLYEQ